MPVCAGTGNGHPWELVCGCRRMLRSALCWICETKAQGRPAARHNGPSLRAVAKTKGRWHLHVYLGGFSCACFHKADAIEVDVNRDHYSRHGPPLFGGTCARLGSYWGLVASCFFGFGERASMRPQRRAHSDMGFLLIFLWFLCLDGSTTAGVRPPGRLGQ